MYKTHLNDLKKLDYRTAGEVIADRIKSEGCSPDLAAGTFALAYVLFLAKQKGFESKGDPIDFIKDEVEDEQIMHFIRNAIAFGWDDLFSLYNQFDTNTLKAFLLYGNFNDMKYYSDSTTPNSICQIAVHILNIKPRDTVADFGTGIGTFLVEAFQECPDAIYFGNEINTTSKSIAYIRAKLLNNISVVQEDMFEGHQNRTFDKIFSNYPFGMRIKDLRGGLDYLERFGKKYPDLSKATSSDWIFNTLIANSLTENGKAVAIMTNGSTWNSIDRPIREFFIRKGLIECVIALPEKLFTNTSIATSMVVFSSGNKAIRMIDASDLCDRGRRQNTITNIHVNEIIDWYKNNSEKSKLVSIEEVKNEEYVLSPVRFIREKIQLKNAVPFHKVIKRITRGAPLKASELDNLISTEPTEIQYLMLNNINNGIISNDLPYLKELDGRYEKYLIKAGDLILSKNGYPFKVAVAQTKPGRKILANGNLYIIELLQDKVNPYYLKAFFESEQGVASLKSIAVGAAIPNIAVESLKNLLIPLDNISKQNDIADEYQILLDEIAVLRFKIEKASNSLRNIFNLERE